MAHYVVGDVQGCFTELEALLKKIKFNFLDNEVGFSVSNKKAVSISVTVGNSLHSICINSMASSA